MGVGASECVRVRGCESCMAFQYSVSVQQGVMLLHCRRERTGRTCVGCVFTLYRQQCQVLFSNLFDLSSSDMYEFIKMT